MRVRVGIDGMGHGGRHLLRTLVDRGDPDFDVVAVRDDAPAARLAERLHHDSTHGTWPHRLEVVGDHLGIDDTTVRVLHDVHPRWQAADVEVVVMTEGDVDPRVLLAHGVRAVLITGVGADGDLTVLCGLNEDGYDAVRHQVVAVPSAAATCAALLLEPLHRAFEVVSAVVTSIEGHISPVAAPDDPRLLRERAVNVVPTRSPVGAEVGAVLPDLDGRVAGAALRVPVVDTGLVEVTARLTAPVTVGQVGRVLRNAAEGPFKGLLTVTTEPTVSRDVLGAAESCRADLGTVETTGELVRILGWHDPETAQAHRVADLLGLVSRLLPR